jgi:hypothetical protein
MIKKFIHKTIYDPLNVLNWTLVALGFIFGLYQGVALFFPGVVAKTTGWSHFVIIIFISIIFGRCKTWKKSRIDFKIPCTDKTIEILFGDLFKQEGMRVIPVNEFFDSEIGNPVSEKSVHGIFIKNHLGGYSKIFDDKIESQLIKIESAEVLEKSEGKRLRYPIGTTVIIEASGEKYLVFALARTRPDTCKAYCDVETMWVALGSLWKKGRDSSGGDSINIPLVGSGQSGVGLLARDLLNLIILSVIVEMRNGPIQSQIRIILQDNYFEKIDLRDIEQYWKRER